MEKFNIADFYKGWIVGNFEPTLLKMSEIEVALQSYSVGDEEPMHYHKIATEISLVVSGTAMFNSQTVKAGEGVIIRPMNPNVFKAITDCQVLVIKYPSAPNDKYMGKCND